MHLLSVSLWNEESQNNTNNDSIGVQVLHLRCRMTGSVWEKRTDSSLIVQNWKYVGEGVGAKRKEEQVPVFSDTLERTVFFSKQVY